MLKMCASVCFFFHMYYADVSRWCVYFTVHYINWCIVSSSWVLDILISVLRDLGRYLKLELRQILWYFMKSLHVNDEVHDCRIYHGKWIRLPHPEDYLGDGLQDAGSLTDWSYRRRVFVTWKNPTWGSSNICPEDLYSLCCSLETE